MADNVTADAGSGGAVFATDEDTGNSRHFPGSKIMLGVDGVFTAYWDGTVTANLSATDNAVLDTIDAVLDTINAKLVSGTVIGDVNLGATDNAVLDAIAASVAGTLTVDLAGNNDVTIDGSSIVHVDDAAFTLGTDAGVMMMGFAGTQSVNANDAAALACETDGALHIHDGGNTITVDGTVTANPASGTITTVSTVTNLSQMGGVAISLNTGVRDTGTQRVTIATNDVVPVTGTITAVTDISNTIDSTVSGDALTALQLIDNVVVTEDAAADANPVGNMMMAVRDDNPEGIALTTANNNVTALRCDQFGALKVTSLPDATSEIKYGIIDAASSGDNTLQAAAGAGIKIRVLSVMMIAAGTVTARFESGAAGTALSGQMNLAVNSGFTLPFNPGGWFQTADNVLLNLELSAAISVDGCFSYVEV